MGRLIDVQGRHDGLSVVVGDILLFHASGGQVRSGAGVIELVGILSSAVTGDDGRVLTPAGAPNVVLFAARNAGSAQISVVTGDPFRARQEQNIEVAVHRRSV